MEFWNEMKWNIVSAAEQANSYKGTWGSNRHQISFCFPQTKKSVNVTLFTLVTSKNINLILNCCFFFLNYILSFCLARYKTSSVWSFSSNEIKLWIHKVYTTFFKLKTILLIYWKPFFNCIVYVSGYRNAPYWAPGLCKHAPPIFFFNVLTKVDYLHHLAVYWC